MNRHIIPCSEEQIRKAVGLGAPIREVMHYEFKIEYQEVTAEQMIGWLEDQEEIHEVEITTAYDEYGKGWCYCIFNKERCNVNFNRDYPSRIDATLAAIDAALEYLENNK